MKRSIVVRVLVIAAAWANWPALAVPITWDGGGANNTWTTALNWSNDATISSGNDYVIATTSPRLAASGTGANGTFVGNSLTLTTNGVLDCLNGGTINSAGLSGQGALILSGGELRCSASSGTKILKVTNAVTYATYVTAGTTNIINVYSGTTLRHDTSLAGSGTLRKTGAGSYNYSLQAWMTPAFVGTLLIDEGTVNLNATNNLAGTTIYVNPSGALLVNGSGNANVFGVLKMNGGAITNDATVTDLYTSPIEMLVRSFFTGGSSYKLQMPITGNGNMVWATPVKFSLYSSFNGSSYYGAAELGSGTTLDMLGVNATLGGLVSTGTNGVVYNSVDGTTSTLTLQPPAGVTNDYAGVLSNGSTAGRVLALTLTNAGVQRLSGTNTYSGATTVNGGTLVVNGLLATNTVATVTVNAGGTLGGMGTIDRAVIVNSGAVLSPGDAGVGTLTVSNLVLSVNCTNRFELAAPNVSDKVVVKNELTLDGTLEIRALPGLTADTYILFTCASHSGSATVLMPEGWTGALDTTTSPTEVKLVVTSKIRGTVILLQ